MLRRHLKYLAGIVITAALFGCGSGGGELSGTLSLTATSTIDPSAAEIGTATASYSAADGRNPIGLKIDFTSDRPDIVALDSSQVSVGTDGKAIVTFRAITVPTDTKVNIFVRTGGLSQFQQITVKGNAAAPPVIPPSNSQVVNAVTFVSATPTNIALKGTGGVGRPESSIVTFRVVDTQNNPMQNVQVDFSLDTAVGGIKYSPTSGTSDAAGNVSTIVNSGTILTSVRVTAAVHSDPTIFVKSSQLSITSGMPDQDSFSIAAATLNSESYNHDGVIVPITVRLADHFNNPPPDGTVVTFTTNAGKIVGTASTVNGVATANWESQAPRPTVTISGKPTDGRFVVMAYAIGEESFTDLNGNGLADAGEFTDDPEAFRDDNFNGVRDANEPFIDFNKNGTYDVPDGKFNGAYQGAGQTSYQNGNAVPTSKHIFGNIQLVMSTDAADITWKTDNSNNDQILEGPGTIAITVKDMNGNTMAAGTTITVTGPGFGTLFGLTPYVVPNNIGYGQLLQYALSASASPQFKSGFVTVSVKSPGGLTTTAFIPVSGSF